MNNDQPMNMNNAQPVFDLSAYELEDFGVLRVQNAKGNDDLLGPNGEPVTIELWGPGSDQAVQVNHKAGQRASARLQQIMKGKTNKKDAEQAEEEEVDKLVAMTRRINNFPVDPRALYANPGLVYITRQVKQFLADDSNFSKG